MRLTAGILGFGDAMRFVPLVEAVQADPLVDAVRLYWNAPPDDARARLAAVLPHCGKLQVELSRDNRGSAGGYAALLRWFATQGTAPLLWLLDDDARPDRDCTRALVARAQQPGFDPAQTLLMSYRADLPEFAALVEGGAWPPPPRAGTCAGIHLANLWRAPTPAAGVDLRHLPSAPWGGLVVPRQALARLGLPDERLFLYGEDLALTLAFTRSGGTIALCAEAVVRDAAPVWNAPRARGGAMRRRVALLDEHQAFYETRGTTYVCARFYPGSRFTYQLNRVAFLGLAMATCLRYGRWRRLSLLWRALREGERLAHAVGPRDAAVALQETLLSSP